MSAVLLPCQTLYIKNLPEKVSKDLLKKSLHALFTPLGKVLDVTIFRTKSLRGQAWLSFDNVQSATVALSQMQGVPIDGKPMSLQYSKSLPDSLSKKLGQYPSAASRAQRASETSVRRAASAPPAAPPLSKRTRVEDDSSSSSSSLPPPPPPPPAPSSNVPSRVLVASSLPPECTSDMLEILFKDYPGFVSARSPRVGVGVIDFKYQHEAAGAMAALNGFKLTPTVCLTLAYGKE